MFCRKLLKKTTNFKPFRHYSSDNLINISNERGIRRITMCDKSTRNSLSIPMTKALLNAVVTDSSDLDLRCIIISALGNVFSAGHNLKHLANEDGDQVFNKFTELMMAMIKCPVPIIAAVDGLAAAAGCQLVAQSDIAVCTERSTFSTPGANFGIFCSTPGIPLSRCVPRKLSAYMLFTGNPLSSKQALQHGLVSNVLENNELEAELERITDSIKSKSKSVIAIGKQFYYEQMDMPLEAAYKKGASIMSANLIMEDGQEGLKSFQEKRRPIWKHK